jgi:hypothetical protein
MFCPECRVEHPEDCGTKVFVAAECPICFTVERPTILLPCYHGLCPACFGDVGGALASPRSAKAPLDSRHPGESDELGSHLIVPPPTHVV